jgi:hypothetical protein
MDIDDNDVSTVTEGTDILTVRISSTLPDQYVGGAGSQDAYHISLGDPTFTPDADSEITAGEVSADAVLTLSTTGQAAMEFGAGASGKILTGAFSQPANLVINADKRLYGDTSDSITIEYTFVDN